MSTVIILCGLPGSGKTTFSLSKYSTYERISQDELGNREKCEVRFTELLSQGKNVIVDRTNISRKQRRTWLNLAKEHKAMVKCVFLRVPYDVCVARVLARRGHPTITAELTDEKKQNIVSKFQSELEEPHIEEGFDSLEICYG